VDVLVKWLLAGVMGLLVWPALAKEGDTFRPYVSYSYHYDNNLLRLAEDEDAVIIENGIPVFTTQRSDTYSVFGVGLDVDWKQGRQQVLASASKNLVRYSNFSNFDFDGSDYRGTWNWRLGNHLSGQLGASQVVSQTSFNDLNQFTNAFVAVNNELTTDRFFGSAEWEFHPRWRTGVGLAQSSGENSTLVQRSQDFDSDSTYAYLTYLTPKGSRLRGELRRIDSEFPNRQLVAGSLVDNSYTQDEVNFVGDWSATGKLINRLRVGWVERRHENLSTSDFSGVAGRYTADYFPTGKTAINAAIFREPAGVEDANSSFRLNTGINVNAAWLLSDKTTVRAGVSYVNGDYDQIVPGSLKRNDDDTNGSLSVSYSPIPMATFDAGLQVGRRNSTIDALDYTFRSVFVGARADF
jgi:exopolysaccharide biosynthesis operon protein EpsL